MQPAERIVFSYALTHVITHVAASFSPFHNGQPIQAFVE